MLVRSKLIATLGKLEKRRDLGHVGEGAAVDWTGPMLGQAQQVLAGAVAFVLAEIIMRISQMEFFHQAITCDFSYD